MNITSSHENRCLMEWARHVAQLALERDPQIVETIDSLIGQLSQDRLVLSVIGKVNRGKSTLINVLLGRPDDVAAPIDKLPASSAVSRFRRSDSESATVVRRDGQRQPIAFSQIRQYVTEEGNPKNRKEVAVVEIAGPFGGLDSDLELVDTPGAGSLHEHHDEILHRFLPQSDAVILPLDQEELTLLRRIKAVDIGKLFFVINRMDEASSPDLQSAIDHNKLQLVQAGVPTPMLHCISAKRAFQGDLAHSGVPELCKAIKDFLQDGKSQVIEARFIDRVVQAVQPVLAGIDVENAARRKSLDQLDAEMGHLAQQRQSMDTEREYAGREFQTAWNTAVMRFQDSLARIQNVLSAEVEQLVLDAKLTDVSTLAKQLPTQVTRMIEDYVAPASHEFEATARTLCEKLRARYPSVNVSDSGGVFIRVSADTSWIPVAVGGTAAVATGAGLAVAGSSAAAALAAASVTTVAAPTAVSALLTSVGLGTLAPFATGTVAVANPVAAPLWVALAGPIGWAIAGVGLLAVPLSWSLAKNKERAAMLETCRNQVHQVFRLLKSERVPRLREMGELVLEEFHNNLARQIGQIEDAIRRARIAGSDQSAAQRSERLAAELRSALQSAFSSSRR